MFIGTGLRAESLRAALESCLMAEGEALPPADPFPAWDAYGLEDACERERSAQFV
ncbi:hypothetical protein GCM10010497_24790 [Streptomyces cinereoruber]|uniref:Cobalamin biosynthesis protein CobW n=1 Tax=Streptomyces cinereoruber TaxID=67260 RepID=A0AAV4KHD9_9ACTN|nr:hypothetical protein [Streptomyces cinereoruber]NIH62752.1 hypothetical protein [Streptomyces cinereoruber]GGR21859.1 hypothetical protein GCM10010497_24790 [Streptomyces cinereoruber]